MNVSVIITTFNRPDALKIAVESVLGQSFLPFEIIIVNDGAELPGNEEFISHPLINLINNESAKGANYSRNKGARLSKGEVIMFLDDDDSWEVEKIADQISQFDKDSEVGMVYSGRIMVYDTNRAKEISRVSATRSGFLYPEILESNIVGTTSSVAIKRTVFLESGGFDEAFPAMQDYELWVRVCQLAPVAGDGKYNVRYTLNKNPTNTQISNSGKNQELACSMFLQKHSHRYKQEGLSLRKRRSRMYFYIAKAYRTKNLQRALYFAGKSFFTFPNLPSLAVVFLSTSK